MDAFLLDLRHAIRTFLSRPVLTLTATAALALGVGANTAVFSVVYGILLKPLPFAEPGRLVAVWETNHARGTPLMAVAPPNLDDWRRQVPAFEDLAAFASASLTLVAGEEAEQVHIARVTGNLFDVLGIRAAAGRAFTRADEQPASTPAVVLSDGFWRRRFGGDRRIVGSVVQLGGRACEVVGVMPPGFRFPPPVAFELVKLPQPADMWIPFRAGEFPYQRGAHFLTVIGRLKPGATPARAREEVDVVGARLERDHPATNAGWRATVVPLAEQITGDTRPALVVLVLAVALVLLLACANVAHLLLALSVDRQREIAVRTALGAGRRRLARQLFTEALVLALAGGLAGLLLASWGVRATIALGPPSVPRLNEVTIDWRTFGAALAAAIVAAALSSVAPILGAARLRTLDGLRERATPGRGTRRVQRALIAGEAAVAATVVVIAVLLGESFLRLRGIDPGFTPDRVLSFRLTLPAARYPADAQAVFLEQALARLRALPGVEAASTIDSIPLGSDRQGTSFGIEGSAAFPPDREPQVHISMVSPGYFETVRMPLVEGRTFDERDRAASQPVIIVNSALAKRYFGGRSPLGRRIRTGFESGTVRTIVGVVGDEHHDSLRAPTLPGVYLPVLQLPWPRYGFAVRSASRPEDLARAARRIVGELDSTVAVFDVATMDAIRDESVAAPRFAGALLTLFALVALALAVVGVYGVTSHAVTTRSREIGIRMALGARPADVVGSLVGQSFRLALAGASMGLAGALALSRLLVTLLFGVTATSAHAYVAAGGLVVLVTALACWIPARRTASIDPVAALRAE